MSEFIIGRQLANYRVMRHLGRGGMADVYYGHDIKLDRPVAIKVIDARYRGDPAYAKRFVREARSIAKWRHDNVIQIYYADDEEDFYFFVMEYIDGKDLGATLDRYRARRKLMPQDEVIRIGRAVANALDYAHQQGVVHRDVKPANVMIAKTGRVVLTDFGLALNITEGSSGEVVGSANYVSPEQARNSAEAIPQSDVYSLGVMLYEMLVGKLPFDDPSFTAVAIQHITTPPPPPRQINPDLSEATEAVLLKALHKSPEKRYKTAGQLIDALEKSLAQPAPGTAATAAPPVPARRSPGASRAREVTEPAPVPPKEPARVGRTKEPTEPAPVPPKEPARQSRIREATEPAPVPPKEPARLSRAKESTTPAPVPRFKKPADDIPPSQEPAAPSASRRVRPAEPPPASTGDHLVIDQRVVGVAVVFILILLLVLVLWLLSGPAGAAPAASLSLF